MYATWFSTTETFRRAVLQAERITLLLLTFVLISTSSFADQHSARATLRIHVTVMGTVSAEQPIAVQAKMEQSEGIIYNLNPTTELVDKEQARIEVKSPSPAVAIEESHTPETPAILESLTFVRQ